MRHVVFLLVIAVGGVFLLGGCGEATSEKGAAPTTSGDAGSTSSEGPASTTTEGAPDQPAEGPKDIVDTAVAADDFKTLVAAVQAAGLVETLKGEGPFTVFAPTDAAFAKLPAGTLDELLKPESKDKLTSILTYHVVPGKVMAADVVKVDSAKTVQGAEVAITVEGANVKVNEANVTATDIECSNGVIHVIDAVILPPEKTQ
jgi:uncharacterized surface protein with fasciclin (FAS1) repeats